jgi:hypothetical protein
VHSYECSNRKVPLKAARKILYGCSSACGFKLTHYRGFFAMFRTYPAESRLRKTVVTSHYTHCGIVSVIGPEEATVADLQSTIPSFPLNLTIS